MSTSIDWRAYQEPGAPQLLILYRAVHDHPIAPAVIPSDEVCLTGLRKLYMEKNHIFTDREHGMEMAFLEVKRLDLAAKVKAAESKIAEAQQATAVQWVGQGPCPMCGQTKQKQLSDDECVARLSKWLHERGEE